jgi:acetyltransferase-like isoleucine patch superfamily enzyme
VAEFAVARSGARIGDAASIREQCRIGARTVIGRHVTLNYAVRVGDRTKVMDHAWLGGNMTIGSDVFVAGGVLAVTDNSLGRSGKQADELRGPAIEDGAAIGAGAKLLPGIVIGRRAIVGAGAVVTRDVAPETVVVGVSAWLVRRVEAA